MSFGAGEHSIHYRHVIRNLIREREHFAGIAAALTFFHETFCMEYDRLRAPIMAAFNWIPETVKSFVVDRNLYCRQAKWVRRV